MLQAYAFNEIQGHMYCVVV